MARVLARAWPSSCIRFNSDTPPGVQRSVGSRTSARTWPSRSNARHLTAPVEKSQPVTTVSGATQRRGSAMDGFSCEFLQSMNMTTRLAQGDAMGGVDAIKTALQSTQQML